MDHTDVTFSVVVPVYNSAQTLHPLYERLAQVFSKMEETFEVVFVNDCSKDNSFAVLRELHAIHENVIAINLYTNYGQQNALLCGFNYSSGQYIITMDDDLQNPPEEIPKLYTALLENDFDAVFGSPISKQHQSYRNLGSLFIRRMNHKIFNIPNGLRFSSFRILKKSLVDHIKDIKTPYPYIAGMLMSITQSIGNVEVAHHKREIGRSNYNLKKSLQLSFNLLINYSSIPLKYMSYFGLTVSILSFVIGLFYIFMKLFVGEAPPGWTTIIVLVSFYNSIILLLFFILGEYMSRLMGEVSKKQQYSVKESLS